MVNDVGDERDHAVPRRKLLVVGERRQVHPDTRQGEALIGG